MVLLPSANEIAERLCFYTCLSTGRGCLAKCMLGYTPQQTPPLGRHLPGRHPPGRHPPPGQTPLLDRHHPGQTSPRADTPWADTPGRPPSRRLLLRTVRILLECILVFRCFYDGNWGGEVKHKRKTVQKT